MFGGKRLDVVCLMCCVKVEGLKVNHHPVLPLFWGQTAMLWHQVTGPLMGTGSMTPRLMS